MSGLPPAKCNFGHLCQALGSKSFIGGLNGPVVQESGERSPIYRQAGMAPSASPGAVKRDGLRLFSRAGTPPAGRRTLSLEETQLHSRCMPGSRHQRQAILQVLVYLCFNGPWTLAIGADEKWSSCPFGSRGEVGGFLGLQ